MMKVRSQPPDSIAWYGITAGGEQSSKEGKKAMAGPKEERGKERKKEEAALWRGVTPFPGGDLSRAPLHAATIEEGPMTV